MDTKNYISQAVKSEGVDAIASKARVSRATVFRILAGENARLDTMQRLLSAAGYTLRVVPGEQPKAAGE